MVMLLQPSWPSAKTVSGAGQWAVRRGETGQPYYCAVLEGVCRLVDDRGETRMIGAADFLFAPSGHGFELTSVPPPPPGGAASPPTMLPNGEIRHGTKNGPSEVKLLVGHCVFQSADADLLASLLPALIHIRGEARLETLVKLVSDEAQALRPVREIMMERLLEALFIEAIRSSQGTMTAPGLLRGLADERLASSIRSMHADPSGVWNIARLAETASLSRSAFCQRFRSAVGVAPMEYLLRWRMALAKKLLRDGADNITAVAQQVGYSSASTFTVAFARHVGLPPARYAKVSFVEPKHEVAG